MPELKLHIKRALPLILFLGLVVHFVLPRISTIVESAEQAKAMLWWAIVLAAGAQALSYVANGQLLQCVVNVAGGRVRLRRAIAIEMAAATICLVAGGILGFAAAVYNWLRASGSSRDTAALAGWLPSVFDSASLVIIALISGVELLHVHQLSRATQIALLIVVSALAVVIAGAFVLLAKSEWMLKIARVAARVLRRFGRTVDENEALAAAERVEKAWEKMRSGGWIRPAISSLLVVIFDILTLRLVFLAAHQPIKLSVLLAGYGVPILLGRSSFLPGGIAVVELAMAAIYAGFGIDAHTAIVVVLTYRFLSFWLPTALGIPVVVALQAKKRATAPDT
jgi:glycosyltransferase 2 family protein